MGKGDSPPKVLYHYTTQVGLLGILESREIWLTHTQYLNDRSEYLHALDLVLKRLAVLEKEAKKDYSNLEALEAMEAGLVGIEGVCVCVFSLSEQHDSLSQWRAYGGKNSGYAVGISIDTLHKACERKHLQLAKCIYEIEEQERLVNEFVGDVLRQAIELRQPGVVHWAAKVADLMAKAMCQFAPMLKHSSFSDEKEWRIISGPIVPIAQDLRFRVGVSTVIPYLCVSLDRNEQQRFCPERIIVGPTPHPDNAAHAVRLLLVRHGMETCARSGVGKSEVPYRSW